MGNEMERERRKEAAFERLGTREPRCQHCGETYPAALTGTAPDIVCYQCQAESAERSAIERHHVAGRHNSTVTVSVPANDHRVLSDLQREWPEKTLRNSDGSPLLRAAATLRGWLDVLQLIVERTVARIPPFLELLDEKLRSELGDRWWKRIGLNGMELPDA